MMLYGMVFQSFFKVLKLSQLGEIKTKNNSIFLRHHLLALPNRVLRQSIYKNRRVKKVRNLEGKTEGFHDV